MRSEKFRATTPRGAIVSVMVVLAAIILNACATQTPYRQAANGRGFRDQAIESNHYRISFSANSLTSRETVENYVLYRAAEITLANGKDYFVVVEADTERLVRYHSTHSDNHFSNFPRFGNPPFDGYLGTTTTPVVTYTALAEIQIYQGDKPEDDSKAFDAREVAENLGPTIVRPEDLATN